MRQIKALVVTTAVLSMLTTAVAVAQQPTHQHGATPPPSAPAPSTAAPGHDAHHAQHMEMCRQMMGQSATMGGGMGPGLPGQDAFGAIAEIVKILKADPNTDWSKVDLERLRQHLIDMNEVVLHSSVKQMPVTGGLAMEITGSGRTEQAIRTMVVSHAAELDRMPDWSAKTESLPGGVRLTVIANRPDDASLIARIRGLGFSGLLTEGAHHQPHHLAMARGEALPGHTH
jgi:hypothetical protein